MIEYFLTLVSMPHQDKIKLTIVDGLSGGGLYVNESGLEVPGSPRVILDVFREGGGIPDQHAPGAPKAHRHRRRADLHRQESVRAGLSESIADRTQSRGSACRRTYSPGSRRVRRSLCSRHPARPRSQPAIWAGDLCAGPVWIALHIKNKFKAIVARRSVSEKIRRSSVVI